MKEIESYLLEKVKEKGIVNIIIDYKKHFEYNDFNSCNYNWFNCCWNYGGIAFF